MFRIGEFSKIAQLSMRVLRHYDEIGLFRPERVDEATGYRYYSARQLPELNRILALKMLGLSLDEVKRIMHDDISSAELHGLYKAKKAKLETLLEQERQRLALVESRLAQIDRETLASVDVVLKPLPAQRVLALRETAPSFAEVMTLMLLAQRSAPGPSLAIFYDAHFDQQEIDWEFGLLGDGARRDALDLGGSRRLEPRTLPALELVASTVYEGDYLGLHRGYSALGAWIEEQGFEITGVGREVFWVLDEANPAANVTEIVFPVQEVGRAR